MLLLPPLGASQFGESNRHYASTNMNEHSSRSHVLFRMIIKRGFTNAGGAGQGPGGAAPPPIGDWENDPQVPVRVCGLNYVDLAGSERLKKTGATGEPRVGVQCPSTSTHECAKPPL